MPNFPVAMEWAMASAALLATTGLIYQVLVLVPRGRLLKCPVTGVTTFIEIGRASRGDGSEPKVTVEGCDLWREEYRCTARCITGRKWDLWKWGQVQISEPGARSRIPPLSLETCI